MDHADHIMCVSELTRQTVIHKYYQDPKKVSTVHNAVSPLSQDILDIVPNKNPKEKVVTFLGRITMQKGPEYFVEAAAMVLQRTKNVRFVMAGSGDMMNQMIRLVAERGIADRFHFPGFMKGRQVYEVLKASAVYIMPSVSEPFGISPLEAMQCSVPTIISKQSGQRFWRNALRRIIGTFMRWQMQFIPFVLILRCMNICVMKGRKKWTRLNGKTSDTKCVVSMTK